MRASCLCSSQTLGVLALFEVPTAVTVCRFGAPVNVGINLRGEFFLFLAWRYAYIVVFI
jgi:hypothetical protein